MTWQRFNVDIPKDLKPDERKQLADLIIEHIFERTSNGVDKNGKKFPAYSKEYMQSLDFKVAHKSKQVNLQLSGDMLAAVELLNHSSGKLTIGFKNGTPENDKAEGNILGTYGQSSSTGKKRDFLGIESKKLQELIDSVSTNVS